MIKDSLKLSLLLWVQHWLVGHLFCTRAVVFLALMSCVCLQGQQWRVVMKRGNHQMWYRYLERTHCEVGQMDRWSERNVTLPSPLLHSPAHHTEGSGLWRSEPAYDR